MLEFGTEVKVTLPADQVASAHTVFGLRGQPVERRDIYFVEALDPGGVLRLHDSGVIVRVRRRADDSGDVTVKLRPAVRDRLIGRWRPGTEHKADYRVETDWAKTKVLAASVTAKHESGVDLRLDGPRKKLLTDEQQHFLRRCGPELTRPFHGAVNAGPIIAHTWHDLAMPGLRAEQWTWRTDRRFLELSLRCADEDAAAEQRALLAAELERHGLKPDDAATTKTEAVLRDLL
jgi:hypothetical protein